MAEALLQRFQQFVPVSNQERRAVEAAIFAVLHAGDNWAQPHSVDGIPRTMRGKKLIELSGGTFSARKWHEPKQTVGVDPAYLYASLASE